MESAAVGARHAVTAATMTATLATPVPPSLKRNHCRLSRARFAMIRATRPSRNESGIASPASSSPIRGERRETSTAAGKTSRPRTASTSATHERLLLLDVGAASGGGRGCTADDARDGDQRQHVRQRLEEHRRRRPRLLEPERECRRAAEQERRCERSERTPVTEDDRGERDEAASCRHVLAERAEVADRQVRAAERGEHP